MDLKGTLSEELAQQRRRRLYRSRRVVGSAQGPEVEVDGRRLLSFCSNDYLGLAADSRVARTLADGASRWGAGSGAAHLVSGHSKAHHALEEELADFVRRPRALLFSTGYMANVGTISALTGQGDAVFEDRLNHASLLDGALQARARLVRYPHGAVDSLSERLAASPARRKLVATDGVFSMDGDIAPAQELARAAAQAGAWLMLDDAHGLGVLGPEGRGTAALYDLDEAALPILVGTLGKAFGTFGAFVAGSEELVETLIQKARSYIYTTALPPAVAEATRASLRLVREENWRRERLQALIARFRAGARERGLELMPSETPIQPLLAGSSETALRWSAQLEQRGILISAIRPPTVPEGSARLRIALSAAHTEAQVDRLLETLAQTAREPHD